MSGVVKAVKKVFKKVASVVKKAVKAVSKIAKPLLIAAAVYFTAGAAIGAFGGSSLISSMPGWGSTGLFTKAATAIGIPGFGGAAASTAIGMAPTVANAAAISSPGAALAQSIPAMEVLGGAHQTIAGSALAKAGSVLTQAPVQAGGLIGKVAGGVGKFAGWLGQNPGAAMVLGQGVSGGVQSYMADKTAKEEREYNDQKDRQRGFFGMDQVGNQINLPTSGGGLISNVAAPTVQGQQTQTQLAQLAQPAYLTPSQLLEMQRQAYIKNPNGVA